MTNEGNFKLKKKIGLGDGIAIVAGTIVGSGIFVSPVGILKFSNISIGVSLLIWAVCAVLSLFIALCFAELGTSIPEGGHNFTYLKRVYGPIVAFSFLWAFLFQKGSSMAASAVIFGTYFTKPFYPGCNPPDVAIQCTGAVMIFITTLINYINVNLAIRTQIFFTISKYIGMLIIVVAGIVALVSKNPVGIKNFENAFDNETLSGINFGGITMAIYQGLFAYGGYANLNHVTQEIRNSSRNVPGSIVLGLFLVTVFYLLINVAYLSVLTPTELISSKAVAITFADRVLGSNFSWLMPLVVCLSVFGANNGSVLSLSRLYYYTSNIGYFPQIFGMIHTKYVTPGPAIILNSVSGLILLVISSDFDTLINGLLFSTWVYFSLAFAGIVILRWKEPNLKRPLKLPILVPIISVLICLYLVVAPLIYTAELYNLYATIFMLLSLLVYYVFIHKQIRIPWMDNLTTWMQIFLDVAPPDNKTD